MQIAPFLAFFPNMWIWWSCDCLSIWQTCEKGH